MPLRHTKCVFVRGKSCLLEFCRGFRSRHHCAPESPEELLTSLQHLGPMAPPQRSLLGASWALLGSPWTRFWLSLGRLGCIFGRLFADRKIHKKSDSSKSRPKSKKLGPGHQNVDFLMILGAILASMFNQFLMRFRKRPKARISFKNKINIFTSLRHPFFEESSIKISSFF